MFVITVLQNQHSDCNDTLQISFKGNNDGL